ncbi:MAG: hypothetical protein JW808_08440 [Victivallales bacterium]|nr:hypothetical protein [Victivallales bacterium]
MEEECNRPDDEIYGTLILGATMAGLGIAESLEEDFLLVERLAVPGYEFVSAFEPGWDWPASAKSAKAKNLEEELVRRGILDETSFALHIPALAPVLCNLIYPRRGNFLFWTEVVRVERLGQGEGFCVTLSNASGIARVKAANIVNTNTRIPEISGRHTCNIPLAAKYINAMLCRNVSDDMPPPPLGLVPGKHRNEAVLRLPVDVSESLSSARERIMDFWAIHPARAAGWRIASIATVFSERPVVDTSSDIPEGFTNLTSITFGNPISAYDAGALYKVETRK